MKTFLIRVLLVFSVLGMTMPSQAQIASTILYTSQSYNQTNAGLSYEGSFLALELPTWTANSFTEGTVLVPGASSPTALTWSQNQTVAPDGTYDGGFVTGSFPSQDGVVSTNLAALNSAFPFGTYTFTARNNVTLAQQSATLTYNANYWPTTPAGGQTAVPALAAASFASLQGWNAKSAATLAFNSFTGNAVTSSNSSMGLLSIYNASTSELVYNAAPFAASAGSIVLPSNTLEANTHYVYYLAFLVTRNCGPGRSCDSANPVDSLLAWKTITDGEFATLMAPPPNTTTVNLQGGTLANPVPLQAQGRIGQVNGSIGGAGAEDFYLFYWAGGQFEANAQLYGADPHDSYQFELIDQHGKVLQTLVLDQSNNFTASLSYNLAQGPNYEVGLLASSSNIDPNYSITLETPVVSVPESDMATLIILGLIIVVTYKKRLLKSGLL